MRFILPVRQRVDAVDRQSHYFGVFDSLRGMAALIVAIYHVEWLHSFYDLPIVRHADFMVDFFFVLSGFCISHVYGNRLTDRAAAKRYLYLRFWRVYPLHFFFLAVLLTIEVTKYIAVTYFGMTANSPPFAEGSGGILLGNLLLIHSLGMFDRWAFNVPSWSISTEAFAYLVFAAVFLVYQKPRARVLVSILFVLGCTSILLVFNDGSLIDRSVRFGFARCLAGFFVGVLVHYILLLLQKADSFHIRPWLLDITSTMLLIGTILLVGIVRGSPLEFIFLPVFGLLILTVALHENGLVGRLFNRKPLLWLGRLSYSIYMSHLAVIFLFSQFLRFVLEVPLFNNAWGTVTYDTSRWIGNLLLVFYIAVVLGVSQLSWIFIENRFRRLSKRRLQNQIESSRHKSRKIEDSRAT